MSNYNLTSAKTAKNDEFYTLYEDIESELSHYINFFRNKIVYCNCDNPEISNFWKYFQNNFHFLELKGLIATHYNPVAPTYKLEIYRSNLSKSKIKDGQPEQIPLPIKTTLIQNGDFRSEECIELLKKADVVVTNPPFSLFREYVAQLIEYHKDFIIIGNKNAITYKEFFPLLKDNKVWIGYENPSEFETPDGLTNKCQGLCRWFTNIDIPKKHENLILTKRYFDDPSLYPKYDNYDAIECSKVKDIPCDYFEHIGVPVTFLDKYNPEQFEIVGLTCTAETMDKPVQIGENFVKKYREAGGTGHVSANMYGVTLYGNAREREREYRKFLMVG